MASAIGRVSRTRTVQVHLKSGKVLKGTIQQVTPDRLDLGLPSGIDKVKRSDITNPAQTVVTNWRKGSTVELALRNGQAVTATLQDRDEDYVWLRVRSVPVMREDVLRVTRRMHLTTAAIGAVAGAALMLCCAQKDSLASGESAGEVKAGYAIVGALPGAAIGALVGYAGHTLYKAEASVSSKPQAP